MGAVFFFLIGYAEPMDTRIDVKRACGAAALVLAVWLAGSGAAAMAAGRVALVIGNGDYARFGELANPANDARAMARKLGELGFTLVGGDAHVDVTRRTMGRLLGDLEHALAEAEPAAGSGTTALVYYSGHGVAEAGSNWLVPVDDADMEFREDVPTFAISVRDVTRRLEGRGGGVNILILDACRNNPLQSRRRTKGAGSKGLSRMDAPSETVIVYAAAPGRVAYGRGGRGIESVHRSAGGGDGAVRASAWRTCSGRRRRWWSVRRREWRTEGRSRGWR